MKEYLKKLLLFTIILAEIVGVLVMLMQFDIISKDVVIPIAAILASLLAFFGTATFVHAILHSAEEEKAPKKERRTYPSVIAFWIINLTSFVLMIITNVLVYVGFSYDSVAFLCSLIIWSLCVVIAGIMYLFDMVIISDEERRRKEHLNEIVEQILADKEGDEE